MLKTAVKMISQLILGTTALESSSSSQPSKPNEDAGYYIWNKGENISLSKYFSTKEFTCQCNFPDCKKQRISKELITKLDIIRIEVKQPLVVTSAFRCHKHQAFLRSAGVNTVVAQVSQHELGNAADVVPKDGKVGDAFIAICAKVFDSIGLAKNFLHLDLRKGFRRWNY